MNNGSELNHTLYLYTPNVDKYRIQGSFLAMGKNGERLIYVTHGDDPNIILKKFRELGIEIEIISPEKLKELKVSLGTKFRIAFDGGSIKYQHLYHEKILSKLAKRHSVLCTYPVTKLHQDMIKDLVLGHEKLVFSSQDTTILSSGTLDKTGLSENSVEKFVKDNLEMIVLSLLFKDSMCGMDIMKTIHKNFNVLISPGTLYPLLHSLMKRGLLKCESGIKKKVYEVPEGVKPKINSLLSERVRESINFSRLLQVEE